MSEVPEKPVSQKEETAEPGNLQSNLCMPEDAVEEIGGSKMTFCAPTTTEIEGAEIKGALQILMV